MAARAANKAECELKAESQRAAESQGGTTITLAMRPNAVITVLADGWLEVPQALSPRLNTPTVPEVAEEIGVPKALEAVVVEKAPPVMGDLNIPVECSWIQAEPLRRDRLRSISRKASQTGRQKVDSALNALGSTPWDIPLSR
jgi:hypothetical protein